MLADWVAQTGDLAALVARGRELAETAMAATARLDPDQLATRCRAGCSTTASSCSTSRCRGVVSPLDAQAGRHLPAHTGQLRDLRP